jgi:DNA-binding transcriptional regulator YhcF (GntR family)
MANNTTRKVDLETGEELLLNSGFSQIYHSWWKIQRTLLDESPSALKVFSWLVEIADRKNSVIASYSAMASSLGINERTAYRAITQLKAKKIITVLKSGNMNVYVLNDRIVWKDTASKKDKYSKFSAEIFITASEQEEPYKSELIGHAVKKSVKQKDIKLSESFA